LVSESYASSAVITPSSFFVSGNSISLVSAEKNIEIVGNIGHKVKIKFTGIDIRHGEYIEADDEGDYFWNKQMMV